MSIVTKRLKYQGLYLAGPATAYGFYLLLLIVALIKQRNGDMNISFIFLTFWGIILFFAIALLSLLGFVHKKTLRQTMLLVNIGVSLAVVMLVITLMFVLNNPRPANFACNDAVRCLFSPESRH